MAKGGGVFKIYEEPELPNEGACVRYIMNRGGVGGLNRVYLEAGTRVLKLLDMLSRRYAVVTSRTRWMTFPGNEPSAYAYEHVHRSCQLSEYSHQTFRLRYNQMRWVESR